MGGPMSQLEVPYYIFSAKFINQKEPLRALLCNDFNFADFQISIELGEYNSCGLILDKRRNSSEERNNNVTLFYSFEPQMSKKPQVSLREIVVIEHGTTMTLASYLLKIKSIR